MESLRQPHADWKLRCGQWVALLALLYAFFAGLKTTVDFDLGWQMATGRYVLQQHAIPRTDLFSYTVPGVSWIYPPFSGVLFYLLFRIGSYAAISWLCALTVVACTGVLVYRRSVLARALILLAIPVLASETMPRASLFTMFFIALTGRILVCHTQGKRVPLWLLPACMVLWPNLHLGFPAGLAMMLGYCLVEACDLAFPSRRAGALQRLRTAAPWLLLSLPATLLNPFGWHIYTAIWRQQQAVLWQSILLEEWQPVHIMAGLADLGWRSPSGAIWFVLLCALAITLGLLLRLRFGAALLMLVTLYSLLQHGRMAGPCVLVLCLIGTAVLDEAEALRPSILQGKAIMVGIAALGSLLVAVRCHDIMTDRTSLENGQLTLFGTGPSWWIPQQAVDAFEQMHPVGNLFAPFDLSSYLTFRLGTQYKDFADGRAIPFGESLVERQRQLASTPLDDAAWTAATARYNIQAVLLPLSRLMALGEAPLAQDCASSQWAPVYMDSTAAIFLRRTPQNQPLIAQHAVNCSTQMLADEPATEPTSQLARMNLYQRYANAAAIYALLGRMQDADNAAKRAESFTSVIDPSMLFVEAQIAVASGAPQMSEALLRQALKLQQSDAGWYNLAMLLASEQRFQDAIDAVQHAIPLSSQPYDRYLLKGQMLLANHDPSKALTTFDQAEEYSPYGEEQSTSAREFRAAIATGRAEAYLTNSDLSKAVEQMQQAVRETPENPSRNELLGRICGLPNAGCATH